MSDERGWYQGGEHGAGGDDGLSEAYREWQRQQQLQRPWDRQQPWQQEAGTEPAAGSGAGAEAAATPEASADSWLRPSAGGQASVDRRTEYARQSPDAQGSHAWRGPSRQSPDEARPDAAQHRSGDPAPQRPGPGTRRLDAAPQQGSESWLGGSSPEAGAASGLPSGVGVPREDDFRPVYQREETPEPPRPQPSRVQPALPSTSFPPQPPHPGPGAISAPNPMQPVPPHGQAPSPQLTPPRPPQPQSAPGHGYLPRQARPHAALPPGPVPSPTPTGTPPPSGPSSPTSSFQPPTPIPPQAQPRLDGPPLPTRARHGAAPDSAEADRPPQPDFGDLPTGADLPRISDPTRRGRGDSGQFKTGQFDAGASSTGQFASGQFASAQFDRTQFEPKPFEPNAFAPNPADTGQRPTGQQPTGQRPSGQRPTGQSPTAQGPTSQFDPDRFDSGQFPTRGGGDYFDSGQHRTAQFGGPAFEAPPRPDAAGPDGQRPDAFRPETSRSEPPRPEGLRPGQPRPDGPRPGQYPAGGTRPGDSRSDIPAAPFAASPGPSSSPPPPSGSRPSGSGAQRPGAPGSDAWPGTRSPSGGLPSSATDEPSTGSIPRQSRLEAGRAARAEGRTNRDIDLDDEESPRGRSAHGRSSHGAGSGRGEHGGNNGAAGGNRKLMIIGGTVGVVVLALIAYFVTRPSGNSGSGAVADPTSASQGPMNQTTTTPDAGAMASASATNGAMTNGSGSPSASASAPGTTGAAAVDVARVHVAVFNASGISQRASMIKAALVKDGFALATVGGNMTKTTATKIFYPSTRADSAAAVAKALAVPTANLTQSNTYTEVTVVIGTDWATGDTYPAG